MLYAIYTSLNKSRIHTWKCPSYVGRKMDLLPDNYWHSQLFQTMEEARDRAEAAAKRGGRNIYHVAGCKRCGT